MTENYLCRSKSSYSPHITTLPIFGILIILATLLTGIVSILAFEV